MSKFDIQDQEVISMCNARRLRQKMEDQRIIEAEYVDVDDYEDLDANERVRVVAALGGIGARACLGCLFLGAISGGWIDTVFGLIMASACFVWCGIYSRKNL